MADKSYYNNKYDNRLSQDIHGDKVVLENAQQEPNTQVVTKPKKAIAQELDVQNVTEIAKQVVSESVDTPTEVIDVVSKGFKDGLFDDDISNIIEEQTGFVKQEGQIKNNSPVDFMDDVSFVSDVDFSDANVIGLSTGTTLYKHRVYLAGSSDSEYMSDIDYIAVDIYNTSPQDITSISQLDDSSLIIVRGKGYYNDWYGVVWYAYADFTADELSVTKVIIGQEILHYDGTIVWKISGIYNP